MLIRFPCRTQNYNGDCREFSARILSLIIFNDHRIYTQSGRNRPQISINASQPSPSSTSNVSSNCTIKEIYVYEIYFALVYEVQESDLQSFFFEADWDEFTFLNVSLQRNHPWIFVYKKIKININTCIEFSYWCAPWNYFRFFNTG